MLYCMIYYSMLYGVVFDYNIWFYTVLLIISYTSVPFAFPPFPLRTWTCGISGALCHAPPFLESPASSLLLFLGYPTHYFVTSLMSGKTTIRFIRFVKLGSETPFLELTFILTWLLCNSSSRRVSQRCVPTSVLGCPRVWNTGVLSGEPRSRGVRRSAARLQHTLHQGFPSPWIRWLSNIRYNYTVRYRCYGHPCSIRSSAPPTRPERAPSFCVAAARPISLWVWEFQPPKQLLCSSQTLWNPESWYGDWPQRTPARTPGRVLARDGAPERPLGRGRAGLKPPLSRPRLSLQSSRGWISGLSLLGELSLLLNKNLTRRLFT